MLLKENLKIANELKITLDSYRPLSAEIELRIMQKFRLDWNYHSSHIEGNQLTYGETKALLLFGSTAQAKPLKDHIEMTGHNEAIKNIEEVIQHKRPLTENFIRELHQLILKEPYEVDAITPDGKPTRRVIKIGQYKSVPNHVKTKTGEIFYFASPEETPAKMNDLMTWYQENNENKKIHPVLFATEFHYKFICIHPFDDGNGRIARLLMNFILLMEGYPPAIIKTEEKNDYFNALQQADAGQLEYFFNFICSQEVKSLELMLKGAKGEDIEDPEDIDKKIALLEMELEIIDSNEEVKYILSNEVFVKIFHDWLGELINRAVPAIQKFNRFFTDINHWINLSNNLSMVRFVDESPAELLQSLNKQIMENINYFQMHESSTYITADYGKLIKGGLKTFDCNYLIEIKYNNIKYEVLVDEFNAEMKTREQVKLFEKLLHIPLTESEIIKVVSSLTQAIFEHIDYNTKKNGLR